MVLQALHEIMCYSGTARFVIDILFGLLTLLTASDTCEWIISPSKSVNFLQCLPPGPWTNIAYPSFTTTCFLVDVIKLTVAEKVCFYQFFVYG